MTNILTQRAAVALVAMAALCSCAKTQEEANVVARVANRTLTEADIKAAIPPHLSPSDSMQRVNAFIDNWIADNLITEVAIKNLHDTREIDRMTEEYRRQLIMWEYRRLKVAQDTSLTISTSDIDAYYTAHSAEMHSDEPMVKGIFIAMPANSPALANVKRWYRSAKSTDIERLEKVGLTEAMRYEYFRNRWLPWSDVTRNIPDAPSDPRNLELERNGTIYLLNLTEIIAKGEKLPREAADCRIREMLERQRAAALDSRLRDTLYHQSLRNGTVYRR